MDPRCLATAFAGFTPDAGSSRNPPESALPPPLLRSEGFLEDLFDGGSMAGVPFRSIRADAGPARSGAPGPQRGRGFSRAARTVVGFALACCMALLCAAGARAEGTAAPVYPIRQGDLHGLIDAQGRIVLPAEFSELKIGDPLILARKGSRVAYFDVAGKMVVGPQEAWWQPFTNGLTPMMKADGQGKSRWGYATPDGRMAIEPNFDEARPFVDGLAVVGVADAWGQLRFGVIDREGRRVLEPTHEKLLQPAGGLVRAESKQRTHRVFDARGRDITPADVDFVGIPSEGLVRVWSGRRQGFMTVGGELRIPPTFEQASEFREGRARVWVNGRFGFIDAQGKLVVPAEYESAEDFSEGLALVRRDGRSFFIDPQGQVRLEPRADRAWSFSDGLAAVKVGQQHGFIDARGQTVIAPRFSFVRPFQRGLAYVGEGRSSGYIRRDGQYVWRSDAP